METRSSWGRYFHTQQTVNYVRWQEDFASCFSGTDTVLPYGLGRSYGDSCLNDGGSLVDTAQANRLLNFDPKAGVLTAMSGVTIADILEAFVPRGWFPPVTPGTKFVTIGGAIANDVHGKNHHVAGTFGRHVLRFALRRSDGQTYICSPKENPELYAATIGGLGLTGVIEWAEVQLQPIKSDQIDQEVIRFENLEAFFTLDDESKERFAYTMAWVDCLAPRGQIGRGLYMRGNHAEEGGFKNKSPNEMKLGIPIDFPNWLLNKASIKAFNFLYFRRQLQDRKAFRSHYNPFFYPLDAIHRWNRIYGKRGFFQYQFVVPIEEKGAVREMFYEIAKAGTGSFLAVLKRFGDIPSPGMLSFPSPGVTLALDFPNEGNKTTRLFHKLDDMVREAKGRLYPAKDSWMSGSDFRRFYPNWAAFQEWKDPRMTSGFWRRVMKEDA